MKNLYLYGCGNRCEILLKLLREFDIEIAGIVDSNPDRWGKLFHGYMVSNPACMREEKDVSVCVTFYSSLVEEPLWQSIHENYKIPTNRIYTFHDVLLYIYKNFPIENNKTFSGRRKILFDSVRGLGLGGVESWLKDIVKGFDSYGYENVYLLTKRNQEEVPEEVERHIMELYYPEPLCFSKEYVEKGIEMLLKNMPCTIVFSKVNELLLAASLVKKKYPDSIKIIMSVHGSCDGMCRDVLSYKEGISQYVCVSSGMKKMIMKAGMEEQAVKVMTCPIAVKEKFERAYTLDREKPLQLGYAGRLEIFEKRLDILHELLKELEKRNVNYHFDIAGTGSYLEKLQEYVKEQGLEHKISILGQLDRAVMDDFWQRQDVAMNTSDNEGRPLSNMEAMINGAVPVVTETMGILDDVKDGVNGFIVPIGDYVCMADKIQHIELHREILNDFGVRAREEMLEKHNLKKHMELWCGLTEDKE